MLLPAAVIYFRIRLLQPLVTLFLPLITTLAPGWNSMATESLMAVPGSSSLVLIRFETALQAFWRSFLASRILRDTERVLESGDVLVDRGQAGEEVGERVVSDPDHAGLVVILDGEDPERLARVGAL